MSGTVVCIIFGAMTCPNPRGKHALEPLHEHSHQTRGIITLLHVGTTY